MASKSELRRMSAQGFVRREDGVLDHVWPNGQEDRLHKWWHDGEWYVVSFRWAQRANGEWFGIPTDIRIHVTTLVKLLGGPW